MPTDAITTSLLRQLSGHRATLQTLLAQRAGLGILYAPPSVHNGIAQARAAIAQLKVDLRGHGVAVDDEPGDVAGPEDAMPTAGPGAGGQYAQGNQNVQVIGQGNNVTVNYGGAAAPLAPVKTEAMVPEDPSEGVRPILWDLDEDEYIRNAQKGVREIARRVNSGSSLFSANVSVVTLLVAGGLAQAVLPSLGGVVALDTSGDWLEKTGDKAFKNWFAEWADGQGFQPSLDYEAAARMATALDQAMHNDAALAHCVLHWLDQIDALNSMLAELKGAAPGLFVERLHTDLAGGRLNNRELREWTQRLKDRLA